MRGMIKFSVLGIFIFAAAIAFPKAVFASDILDSSNTFYVPDQPADLSTAVTTAQPEASPVNTLTYIDISIDDQTLVYYVNGVPVIITPCVTGSPGRSTPKGVFAINSCIPGKRLKGPTWNVWVDRWMRFCGNVGIHDAKWRKSFGGEIYKKNGSHGCVNIPHDQAVQLYSMVGVGTTVIVH